MITFEIDEIVPCLKNVNTGEIVETEVIKIVRKSVLSKYNNRTGWYTDWSGFEQNVEVYALVIKGTFDVQGLIAIEYSEKNQAVHIRWACTAPENNVYLYGKQKYSGVGGHLLAIASELSKKCGYDGFIYAEAMDEKLLSYYIETFKAIPLPSLGLHKFRFMLDDKATEELRKVYTYEWTNESI